MTTVTTITWRDVGLRERVTLLHSSGEGAPTDTLDFLRVLSNATVTSLHSGLLMATGADAPGTASFSDLDDIWIITGQDAGNYRTQLYIPAALTAAAIADGINYTAASSEWIAIEAALPALAVPYTGDSIQEIVAATIARGAPHIFQTWLNLDQETAWARRTMRWYGTHGQSQLTHLIGLTDSLGADFDTVMNAFMAVSAAVVTHFWEGEMSVFLDEPTTDQYNSVRDYCIFTFSDERGNLTEVSLPAPNRVIFLPDGKTLNMAQANVAVFIEAAIAQLIVPTSGLAVAMCVGGHLAKHPVY